MSARNSLLVDSMESNTMIYVYVYCVILALALAFVTFLQDD